MELAVFELAALVYETDALSTRPISIKYRFSIRKNFLKVNEFQISRTTIRTLRLHAAYEQSYLPS